VPPRLRKPKFGKVQKLNPGSKGINLQLKCLSIEEIKNDEAKDAPKMWLAEFGDDTGIVSFRLRDQKYVDMCKAGSSVVVQNARISMVKGHIHVIIDKWGVMRVAEKAWEFELNKAKNITATEYELTKE
jgi:ssDNA-binding replication factor A large subunit